MKTKKIITKLSLMLIVFVSFYLHSCQRGEWCADCHWDCEFYPLGPTDRTFCAPSFEECEAEVQDFLNSRFYPDCWRCTDPYED